MSQIITIKCTFARENVARSRTRSAHMQHFSEELGSEVFSITSIGIICSLWQPLLEFFVGRTRRSGLWHVLKYLGCAKLEYLATIQDKKRLYVSSSSSVHLWPPQSKSIRASSSYHMNYVYTYYVSTWFLHQKLFAFHKNIKWLGI